MAKNGAEIKLAFCEFYKYVFYHRAIDADNFKRKFLCLLPSLDGVVVTSLKSATTVGEVERAVYEINAWKLPDPNGLSAAFYKVFKSEISPLLLQAFSEAYDQKMLPPSFSRYHAGFIPKTIKVKLN